MIERLKKMSNILYARELQFHRTHFIAHFDPESHNKQQNSWQKKNIHNI